MRFIRLHLARSSRHQELQRLSMRLELMPSHGSMYLLRNVLTASTLMYFLQTALCTGCPELPKFDAVHGVN